MVKILKYFQYLNHTYFCYRILQKYKGYHNEIEKEYILSITWGYTNN